MICIVRKGGMTTSAAYCDKCGCGVQWQANVSISQVEKCLRRKGWSAGIKHVCVNCKQMDDADDGIEPPNPCDVS